MKGKGADCAPTGYRYGAAVSILGGLSEIKIFYLRGAPSGVGGTGREAGASFFDDPHFNAEQTFGALEQKMK